ncbi:N-6 DNA methylase [Alloacidobacterium dinghuense]|uniref:N-6 DNA methylase n=1 Tax=Alloacidobacterium dinghuense TaxID=2763107 RepID=UPI001C950B73|nr:N-6 DNA methylase [Alloacidobacterium dinghuense]
MKGDAYEGLLEKNAADVKGGAGQYFTPRALIQAIVDVMRPEPGQLIHDPACGTGGFLLAAYDYITKHHKLDKDQKLHLKNEALSGVELVDATARICAMTYTGHRNFKSFHVEQAIAFKKHLAEQKAQQSGENLSKATLYATLTKLKRFFQWLAWQPGYKSRLQYSDAEYFNLSDNDTRIAVARREQRIPTLEQIKHVIHAMPGTTEIERRNRALIAFTLLTGARDSAIASMKLKHIDLVSGCAHQDARDVKTKFSKTFTTYFFPVGEEVHRIVEEWVSFLREEKLWGNEDPLFPSTRIALGANHQFGVTGLDRAHWSSASPIRAIFRDAFELAGLPYFNPHCFRNTLVKLGEDVCKTPEEFKAWSQNLGHEKVLTTFLSYGAVASHRQGEIIRGLGTPQKANHAAADEIVEALFRKLRSTGVDMQRL